MASPPLPKSFLLAVAAVAAAVLLSLSTAASAADLPPYTNHTVGGTAGWRFNQSTNFSAWAAGQSFYLGDFLIFNTDGKSTVVQTYNATTYKLCTLEQDFGNLSSTYNSDSADTGVAGMIPVQLTVTGDNYYFSDAFNGKQCQTGMRFHFVVQQGRGLPSELSQPPPPPFSDTHPLSSPSESPPATSQQEGFYRGNGGGGVGGPPWMGLLGLVFSFLFWCF